MNEFKSRDSTVEPPDAGDSRHGLARTIRQWAIARVTDLGLSLARILPASAVDRIEHLLASAGPELPVVARNVAANMRALGLYSPAAHREYFADLAAHLVSAMHIWRIPDPGDAATAGSVRGSLPASIRELLQRRVELDDSIEPLRTLVAGGQGAVLVGPHLSGYLLYLARLNQVVPLTAYMRPTKKRRRRSLQERWMRTVGLRRLVDPESTANPTLVMAAAVRCGGVVYITPDLPRQRDEGTPVRFFEREIYLPGGFGLIARRAAAPIYFLTAHRERGVCRLGLRGPHEPPTRSDRRSSETAPLQWFADEFERFLRADPGMWYFWADKRWTRVLAGDPRYSRRLDAAATNSLAASTPARS